MSIFAIIITFFLERYKYLDKPRTIFHNQVLRYIKFFINKPVENQRQIRYVYLSACAPIVLILLGLRIFLVHHHMVIYILINTFLFALGVHILTWKQQAKIESITKNYMFIQTFAINFFAALFWFLVLPASAGLMCYIIITLISNEFRLRNLDSVIYNITVDKMLFYANIIPYSLLFLFIAIAGNFEDVTHYLLEQRKNFTKSFLFLENTLQELVLISLGKEKFQLSINSSLNEISEAGELYNEKFNPQISKYIVAILYRAGIFFVALVGVLSIANLLR